MWKTKCFESFVHEPKKKQTNHLNFVFIWNRVYLYQDSNIRCECFRAIYWYMHKIKQLWIVKPPWLLGYLVFSLSGLMNSIYWTRLAINCWVFFSSSSFSFSFSYFRMRYVQKNLSFLFSYYIHRLIHLPQLCAHFEKKIFYSVFVFS